MDTRLLLRRGAHVGSASLMGLAVAALLPSVARAQEGSYRFEARVGAVYTSTLANASVQALEAQGTSSTDPVELRAQVGPSLDGAFLYAFSDRVDGGLRIGVSWSGLQSTGPADTWDAGSATAVSIAAGLDVSLAPSLMARGGLGTLLYSSQAQAFGGGASTGLMLTGGVGYWIPARLPVGLRVDADIQYSGFGSPSLREAGAADGASYRVLLGMAASFGAAR